MEGFEVGGPGELLDNSAETVDMRIQTRQVRIPASSSWYTIYSLCTATEDFLPVANGNAEFWKRGVHRLF